ncbi:hypothetical protein GQ457_12G019390 [Hibiscus cannabinus]
MRINLPHLPHHFLSFLHFLFQQKSKSQKKNGISYEDVEIFMKGEIRVPEDHLRETEPVNMDQKASKRIAVKTQNLYPLLPNKPAMGDLSFLRLRGWIAMERELGESLSIFYLSNS